MTNKNHFLTALLYGYSLEEAAIMTTPDSVRCWVRERALTHFTINPHTGEVSGMEFPDIDTRFWTEDIVQQNMAIYAFNAGKPGEACIDEPTIPNEFWAYNEKSPQNNLFYLHLIQDRLYDRFIRSVIDCSRRYEDIYIFNGEVYNGADLRGKGMARWNDDGLLNQFDAQFFTRLAKRYFEKTGMLANSQWIEDVMKPSIFGAYSEELAHNTVKFISLHPLSDELISQKRFDEEIRWPVPNRVVDTWIEWLFEELLNECIIR